MKTVPLTPFLFPFDHMNLVFYIHKVLPKYHNAIN